jgi:hypothetical protein
MERSTVLIFDSVPVAADGDVARGHTVTAATNKGCRGSVQQGMTGDQAKEHGTPPMQEVTRVMTCTKKLDEDIERLAEKLQSAARVRAAESAADSAALQSLECATWELWHALSMEGVRSSIPPPARERVLYRCPRNRAGSATQDVDMDTALAMQRLSDTVVRVGRLCRQSGCPLPAPQAVGGTVIGLAAPTLTPLTKLIPHSASGMVIAGGDAHSTTELLESAAALASQDLSATRNRISTVFDSMEREMANALAASCAVQARVRGDVEKVMRSAARARERINKKWQPRVQVHTRLLQALDTDAAQSELRDNAAQMRSAARTNRVLHLRTQLDRTDASIQSTVQRMLTAARRRLDVLRSAGAVHPKTAAGTLAALDAEYKSASAALEMLQNARDGFEVQWAAAQSQPRPVAGGGALPSSEQDRALRQMVREREISAAREEAREEGRRHVMLKQLATEEVRALRSIVHTAEADLRAQRVVANMATVGAVERAQLDYASTSQSIRHLMREVSQNVDARGGNVWLESLGHTAAQQADQFLSQRLLQHIVFLQDMIRSVREAAQRPDAAGGNALLAASGASSPFVSAAVAAAHRQEKVPLQQGVARTGGRL